MKLELEAIEARCTAAIDDDGGKIASTALAKP